MKRSLTYRGFLANALSLNAGFSQTLLLRGTLVAAVLAIIAGIFGMHVMTGNHAAHGNHEAAVQVGGGHENAVDDDADHAAMRHTLAGHTAAGRTVAADLTSCAGSCHRIQEAGTSCVPSAKAGALTVLPPHENRLGFPAVPESRTGPAAAYAHIPPSPTPCELSISRT